jgi:arylsulfatase A-like enzyme
VIADGYKLIAFGDDRTFKLYNLDRDPGEEEDLVEKDSAAFDKMKGIYLEESKKIPMVEVVGGVPLKGARPGQRW